jgi:hypothetical protein
MAKVYCQQSCRQRKVLERLSYSLEKVASLMDSSEIHNLTTEDILPEPEEEPETFDQSFPTLGVPRKADPSSEPFLQIDRGTVIITAPEDE